VKSCPVCNTGVVHEVDTFRNLWRWCLNCGNAFKETKPASVLNAYDLALFELESGYLRNYERLTAGGADPYDKYSTDEYFNSRDHQAEFARIYKNIIQRNKIPLSGDIIDISGGPGGVADLLQDEASKQGGKVYVTELTPLSVDYMKQKLKVTSGKYDFQTDDLLDVFGVQFDVILVRGCINYCLDLRKFAASMVRAAKPGAVVFVSSYLPSLGTMLRWQFDEHFVPVLYNPETIARAFAEYGFILENRYEADRLHYMEGFHVLLHAFAQKYRDAARSLPVPQEMVEKYVQATFRFRG
jgi:SAM-dependent methyltransferase